MGYLHCCGGLRKSKTYRLSPHKNFVLAEIDFVKTCPICGHTIVQLTRIDNENNITTIRKTNSKGLEFFQKLKKDILCEIRPIRPSEIKGRFYLNYNEYGVKKRCYSNLSSLKIGLTENKTLNTTNTF